MLKWWGSPVVCPGWNAMSFSSLNAAEFMWTGRWQTLPGLISFWDLDVNVSVCLSGLLEMNHMSLLHRFQNWNRAGGADAVLVVSAWQNTKVYAFGVFRTNLVDLFRLHGWIWHVYASLPSNLDDFTKDSVLAHHVSNFCSNFQVPSQLWMFGILP